MVTIGGFLTHVQVASFRTFRRLGGFLLAVLSEAQKQLLWTCAAYLQQVYTFVPLDTMTKKRLFE